MQELTNEELQQVSLDLIKDLHRFCVSNQLRYSIAYGTLIGALRHGGFIPWDDDVDVMMPRPDFEKFCKSFTSDKYRLIYYGNDRTALACFARIVDCTNTSYKTERPWTRQESGAWIDIFPIDGVEDDAAAYAKRYNKLKKWASIAYKFRRQNHHIVKTDSIWSVTKTIAARIIGLNGLIPALMIRHMVKVMASVPYDGAKYVGQCTCLDDGPIQFDSADFASYVPLKYEDSEFMSIVGYDRNLRQLYGDYMQLPPEDSRHPKQYWIKFYWKKI